MTRREGTRERVIASSTRPEPTGSVAMVGAFPIGRKLQPPATIEASTTASAPSTPVSRR
jgi:hypothetical protein